MSPASDDQPREPGEDGAVKGDADEQQRLDADRRRRRARVFGEVLPEMTRDDTDDAEEPGDRSRGGAGSDAWWRGQVPPHHG